MFGQVLVELVSGVVATVHEPPHDPGVDEHGQAAVGRTLRQRVGRRSRVSGNVSGDLGSAPARLTARRLAVYSWSAVGQLGRHGMV